MMIKVFVPAEYLTQINNSNASNWPKPSEYWVSKPDSWMARDLAIINVDGDTWARWNSSKISDNKDYPGRQLLHG